MMKLKTGLLALGLLSVTTVGLAAPAFTADSASVNGRLQYGADLEDGDANPYNLGLAVAGGYTLSNGLYLGGNLDYFFGEEKDINSPLGSATSSYNVWQLMGNVGYDAGLGDSFVLRPYGGLGLASVHAKACVNMLSVNSCDSNSETYMALDFGAQPLLGLGRHAFLLADARFNIIFGDETAKAFFFGLGGGAHFSSAAAHHSTRVASACSSQARPHRVFIGLPPRTHGRSCYGAVTSFRMGVNVPCRP